MSLAIKVLFSTLVAAAMAAPVIHNPRLTAQVTVRSTPILGGSSMNMYSPIYYLITKLKLLPKDIIICIINPTKCDPPQTAPAGYKAPAPEAKVPYSKIHMGDTQHVDIFDTAVASQKSGERVYFPEHQPIELRSTSFRDMPNGSPTHPMTLQHQSTHLTLENIAAQR